jgi:urease accessory protein UreH
VNDSLSRIEFTLENRVKKAHATQLEISGLQAGNYSVTVDGRSKAFQMKGGEASQTVDLAVGASATAKVSIARAR